MELISLFVLISLYFMLFIACFWMIAFLDNLDTLWTDPETKKKYKISVIIPAFNEEQNIKKTIKSVLRQDYPKESFEVIVVNDGSTDSTREKCEEFAKKGIIRLFNKENGGKASAMNLGIKKARGELIFILDADSYAKKDCFRRLTGYFDNPRVAAVTSSMKVSSKTSIFQKIQWIEYLFSILMRKVMSLFNCLYVTPGPGSIYRKSVLLEVGGFNEKTLTEDMEMAFNIQNHDYLIENSLNSIVLTNTPRKLNDLVRQRRRWYTGFIEDSASYKHFFFNKNKGFLGYFLLPANVIGTIVLLFISFYSISILLKTAAKMISNMASINFDILPLFSAPNMSVLFYGVNIYSIIGIILFVLSLIIIYYSVKTSKERIDIKSNIFHYLYYLVFYSLIMTLFWTDSIIYKIFFRNKKEGWKYGS